MRHSAQRIPWKQSMAMTARRGLFRSLPVLLLLVFLALGNASAQEANPRHIPIEPGPPAGPGTLNLPQDVTISLQILFLMP